jgi:hypothetical protein
MKSDDIQKEPDKSVVFQRELEKLSAIFTDVEESKRKLVEGCIEDAAFLYAENWELRRLIVPHGTVLVNPKNQLQQKTLPAATQYLKNINSYAVIIKALNSVLSKNVASDYDELSEYD